MVWRCDERVGRSIPGDAVADVADVVVGSMAGCTEGIHGGIRRCRRVLSSLRPVLNEAMRRHDINAH